MASSVQTLRITLPHEVSKRLEHVAHERHASAEEVASSIIEHWLLTKRSDGSVRVVHDEGKERSHGTQSDLNEIIRRQDEEIAWLRAEITRLISISPTIHLVHHGPGVFGEAGTVHSEEPNSEIPSARPGEFNPVYQKDDTPVTPPIDLREVEYSPQESSADPNDLISGVLSDREGTRPEQVSGKTLRDLVGGVTGEKNYSVSEAASIAGEPESVILEYIINGFLPAIHINNTYLIRGNDLRQYMLSK